MKGRKGKGYGSDCWRRIPTPRFPLILSAELTELIPLTEPQTKGGRRERV